MTTPVEPPTTEEMYKVLAAIGQRTFTHKDIPFKIVLSRNSCITSYELQVDNTCIYIITNSYSSPILTGCWKTERIVLTPDEQIKIYQILLDYQNQIEITQDNIQKEQTIKIKAMINKNHLSPSKLHREIKSAFPIIQGFTYVFSLLVLIALEDALMKLHQYESANIACLGAGFIMCLILIEVLKVKKLS